ncbi:MAG: FAD-dependent oxidoreductase [Anaerolineales bacterium]|nr:FAD-dependent oxidoreductase [Anaerolineales bacterium]MDW8447242.1 FAD-dependent oxidoreductase [Anaerolineales bacterium]
MAVQESFSQPIRLRPASAMVIGGGIGGMRAALDLAEVGLKVYLVEQTPCLGGRVAQLGFMFPQHDCVLCRGTADHGYGCTRPSISPAYIQHNQHPNIEILTLTRVTDVAGQAGDFTVSLRQEPRYVEVSRCINCGYCAQVCPVELPDSYQRGLTLRKAAYKVAARATPDAYVIDYGPYCEGCRKCAEVCPTGAINLRDQPRLLTVEVGAIILALGFQVFNPKGLEELGFGRYVNVLEAMQYERLASRSGPTEGIIQRPSDHKKPRSILWLQCVGSRDQETPYCSSICCMFATKEAILAKQRLGKEVECTVFNMDERAFNKEYSRYFARARNEYGIRYVHCRLSGIYEDPQTKDLIVHYATPNGKKVSERFEMVVLATGLQPSAAARELTSILGIEQNEFGFCQTDKFVPLQTSRPGVFVCGAFSSPKEIAETILDASGAAAEVMRLLNDRLNVYRFSHEAPFLSSEDFPPERDISSEPVRVGVFTCTCAGTLCKTLDLKAVTHQAASWEGVEIAQLLDLACFPHGLRQIQTTIQEQRLNRIVIGACSNRTHDSLFQKTVRAAGLNPYLLEVVNLQQQCSGVHLSQTDLANRKAREMLRMAVARVSLAKPVLKERHVCYPAALVIGGGVAGMTAALAIADSGYEVHLVERAEMLGGSLLNLYYVAEGYNPQRLLRDLVNRVLAHTRIQVYTRTEVARHRGHVGDFRSTLHTSLPDGRTISTEVRHGVTIIATGGREAHEHPWLRLPGVITQRQLEEMIIHEPQKVAVWKNVVMIQCVGTEGMAKYCSRVCCTNTMKNAIRLRLFNPGCQVTVLYRNIVTYGFRERYYTEARQRGVLFVRWLDELPPQVFYDEQRGRPIVRVRDLALDRWLEICADVVPLSVSVVPADGSAALARRLRLPLSSEGFFEEAQLKLRPMDFMREGIFLAGMAAYPKFLEESITHALAAAGRALSLLTQKSLYLGGVVAYVDPQKCVGCLTCTRICPFGIPQVIQPTEWLEMHSEHGDESSYANLPSRHQRMRAGVGGLGGAAFIDPAQCQGCGTCTGECPANAIQLTHYTDEQMMLRPIRGLGAWLSEPIH